jgi:hypothetical protein
MYLADNPEHSHSYTTIPSCPSRHMFIISVALGRGCRRIPNMDGPNKGNHHIVDGNSTRLEYIIAEKTQAKPLFLVVYKD